MSETLIKVEGVSKKFCRSLKKSLWYGMQDIGREITGRQHGGNGELRPDEFWAVKDVSFELKRGECIGLIGHNGAGKTTLLKILNGLIKPDQGKVEIRGRVGALIALGAGFNPVLSGRENIYVNASVLGISKDEIDKKIDEIIDFAEIREYIDMPVQNYSSGMTVRLGFSIATTLDPDVLILDEVLAVGDIAFQVKCGARIRSLASKAAVIFVTHNMQYVSLFCNRAILMHGGKVSYDSQNPTDCIKEYLALSNNNEEKSGSLEASIESIKLKTTSGEYLKPDSSIEQGSDLEMNLDIKIEGNRKGATLRINILDEGMNGVMSIPIRENKSIDTIFKPGKHSLNFSLGKIELVMGKYNILVAITDVESRNVLLRHQGLHPFNIKANEMDSLAKIIRPIYFKY
jgi:lipopolysaccharide transport system ATP-binding protein